MPKYSLQAMPARCRGRYSKTRYAAAPHGRAQAARGVFIAKAPASGWSAGAWLMRLMSGAGYLQCRVRNLGLNVASRAGSRISDPSMLSSRMTASRKPIRAWNIILERNQNTMPQTMVVAI